MEILISVESVNNRIYIFTTSLAAALKMEHHNLVKSVDNVKGFDVDDEFKDDIVRKIFKTRTGVIRGYALSQRGFLAACQKMRCSDFATQYRIAEAFGSIKGATTDKEITIQIKVSA